MTKPPNPLIDRRIVTSVVTAHGLSRRTASAVVRLVLAEIAADLLRCEEAVKDPDIAMGVRIARTRLLFASDRTN